jgi:hypothetical protein
MDKNERKNIPLIPFMAAALAPVVAFVLANALFLPLIVGMMDFSNGNGLFAKLLPSNIPGSGYLMAALLVLLFPIAGAAVVVGPALTSFIVNLIFPVLTNRRTAIWSGIVFLIFHTIFQVVLLVFLFFDQNRSFNGPGTILWVIFDPRTYLLLLAGLVLACSVAIFGWLGARLRRKKS